MRISDVIGTFRKQSHEINRRFQVLLQCCSRDVFAYNRETINHSYLFLYRPARLAYISDRLQNGGTQGRN